MDSPKLVCALRLLQGCAEQSLQDQPRNTQQYAVLGKAADLHQHIDSSNAEDFCASHGMQLVAAFSTSRPKRTR